jgi:hypothetical protein
MYVCLYISLLVPSISITFSRLPVSVPTHTHTHTHNFVQLKFEVTDLDEGIYGLESKDTAYAIEIAKVNVPLGGSGLGLGLEELKRGRDGRGCVLVSALQAGGNAEKSKKIKVIYICVCIL